MINPTNKPNKKTGRDQRVVGDRFEVIVNDTIKSKPSILGLEYATAKVIFSFRTAGSRGEVDLVTLLQRKDGSICLALTQAKRNGYVPSVDREKIGALLNGLSQDKSGSVKVLLAYHTDKVRWKCKKLNKASDMVGIPRVRDFDSEEGLDSVAIETTEVNLAHRQDVFEMAVQKVLKDRHLLGDYTHKLNPDMSNFENLFTIRLEETTGFPAIVSVQQDSVTKQCSVLLLYVFVESMVPPTYRAGVEKILALVRENPLLKLFIGYYVTEKTWKLQRVQKEDTLKGFYFK